MKSSTFRRNRVATLVWHLFLRPKSEFCKHLATQTSNSVFHHE